MAKSPQTPPSTTSSSKTPPSKSTDEKPQTAAAKVNPVSKTVSAGAPAKKAAVKKTAAKKAAKASARPETPQTEAAQPASQPAPETAAPSSASSAAKAANGSPNGAKSKAAAGGDRKTTAKSGASAAGNNGEMPMPDLKEFTANMTTVAMRSHDLMRQFIEQQNLSHRRADHDPLNLGETFVSFLSWVMHRPHEVMESQVALWHKQMELWNHTVRRWAGLEVEPVAAPAAGDKRFKDALWAENQVFDFIKQSYLLTADWMQDVAARADELDPKTQKKLAFYTKQIADAISPTNFALTNPEVLKETFRTNGENLVKGLENLLTDLEKGGGKLRITQSDSDYFRVGENIATTPGKVVYQNELMQLIQYTPMTDEVHERPLLIIPPWINKYYILDLQPKNSFIKYCLEQGLTVFVVSWVNPDAKLARKSFADYMHEGIFDSLDAVEAATGMREVNTIGYCIGGTLLASTLAYMAEKGDARISSATFFAAQTDFSEAGDLQVFIDEAQLKALEKKMEGSGGVLEGSEMATTFNMLRANDLIWSFVVNNYYMGKDPLRFDLLYWNSDTTRMPQAMHLFYLHECYRENKLARGEMVLDGVQLDLSKVKTPVYLQSSKDDHIAPYRSVYKSTQLFGGPVRFIMAGSGHIAGVINHPDAQKYQYWTNENQPEAVEDWVAGAQEHPGSWWPDWTGWLRERSGKMVPARQPGDGKLTPIEDAPGSFVLMKAK